MLHSANRFSVLKTFKGGDLAGVLVITILSLSQAKQIIIHHKYTLPKNAKKGMFLKSFESLDLS